MSESSGDFSSEHMDQIGLIIAKVIPSFIIFSLFVSSIDQMTKQCSGKGGPALKELRHNRFDRPYMAPQGIFQTFFNDFFSPFRRFNRETGLQTYYGDQSINYFYRKTNDQSGDYASDVFIESWVWYRQMLFKIAMFISKIFDVKTLIKYTSGAGTIKKDGVEKKRAGFWGSLIRYCIIVVLLIIGIPYLSEMVTLLPIIPGIAGMLGTLVASMRVSIFMKPFILILIVIWLIPAFILFWIQYFHALFVMFTSGIGKNEGFSFRIVFMLLLKRFGLWYMLLTPHVMASLPYPLTYETGKLIDEKTKGNDDYDFAAKSEVNNDTDEKYGKAIRGFMSSVLIFVIWLIIIYLIFPIVLLSKYKSEINEVNIDYNSFLKACILSRYILMPEINFFGKWKMNTINSDVVENFKDFPIIKEYYEKVIKPYSQS